MLINVVFIGFNKLIYSCVYNIKTNSNIKTKRDRLTN